LSELKQSGADSSAKVFTSMIIEYAEGVRASRKGAGIAADREDLAARFSSG
jgi:hypothetical protein